MLKRKALLAAIVCSVFSLCPLLFGQANGSFSGTVSDKTGSVITGASVTVTSQATGLTRDVKTDGFGHYLVPLLPVSTYTIRLQSPGFQTAEQKDLRLQVDEQLVIDFTLNPASVSSTVEVAATEVAVETTNPTLGQVITAEEVADLPLNGRDFVQLATLTPGTTAQTSPNSFFTQAASSEVAARGTFSLSVGGSREQSTSWLIDNNDNSELTSGGIAILPTIDSIQEFKVLTYNYSAEYGTRAGPTVLVTTKSGSNQLHGALYEYFRNTDLDAKSYFAAFKEQFNLNQFGGSLGGPIRKNKTFFFVNYEAKRQRHGIPYTGLVPTAAEMGANGQYADFSGDPFITGGQLLNPYSYNTTTVTQNPFYCDPTGNPEPVTAGGLQVAGTPCNKIPITGGPTGYGLADPIGLALINLFPVGSPTITNGVNYANVPVRRLNEGNATIRVDHNFSGNDSAFARFSYDQANSYVPGGSPTWAEENPFGSNQLIANHGRNVVLSETHILSSKNINQAYFGFNRIFDFITSYGEFGGQLCEAAALGIVGADLNSACPNAPPGLTQYKTACLSCGLSSTQLSTYWSLGDRGFAPFVGGTDVYSFSDTFDMIRGRHNIRAGIGIRFNQMNVMTNGFQDGYFLLGGGFTGDAAADLLVGQPYGAIHDQTFYGATTGRRWKMYRPFVQDDWRFSNDLTLNLGLAWALVTPITEAQNRQANFDWATQQYLVAGNAPFSGCTNCVRSNADVGVKFDKTALEPRIGLAWKPFGIQNTVVRAGYSIYHDSGWSQGAQGLWQNPPYYAEVDQFSYYSGSPGDYLPNPCPFGNFAAGATALNCGLKYGLTQPNLLPFTSPPNPDDFTGTSLSQDANFKQGMVQQFNLNIERQLPGNIVLTAGYAGTRSTHILFYGLNLNVNSPYACLGGPNSTPGYTLGCGPGGAYENAPYNPSGGNPFDAEFTNISNITDGARARYDGLLIRAETKSARHGLYALLSYTWARTFDSGMDDGDGTTPGAQFWPLPGSQKADWGLSQLNLNDQFTASVLYQLPFGKGKTFGAGWSTVPDAILGGWQVNLIEKATSGFPLFVVDSNNQSGVNFEWNDTPMNRPDEVGSPYQGGTIAANPTCVAPAQVHNKQNWFNPCAFLPAPVGELGTASRAPVSGPRFVNTDFSAFKNFRIREGYTVQFRGEFFNLFNHAQFGLIGNGVFMQDINSPSSFGAVNETVNNPRVIQFALRLDF